MSLKIPVMMCLKILNKELWKQRGINRDQRLKKKRVRKRKKRQKLKKAIESKATVVYKILKGTVEN